MKAVILAGGLGTRLSEETSLKPKPMVEVGGRPILWHIMKIYSSFGFNDFVICCGYKGYMIKEYFNNTSPSSHRHPHIAIITSPPSPRRHLAILTSPSSHRHPHITSHHHIVIATSPIIITRLFHTVPPLFWDLFLGIIS